MTPPDSADGYEADLEVMRQDAARWEHAAARLGEASSKASALSLDEAKFSIIGSATGLIGTYDNFRSWMVELLKDGQSNYADLSDALVKAAQTYEAQEHATAGKLQQIHLEGN